MIGGYQMLDLTGATAGDPVTIDGIFNRIKNNNTKPILIKANDGQDVFAQVKEVDGDFVLTYLSAEGKTVKVVIDDEDSVTTTIADDGASIEALSQGLNEISTDLQKVTPQYSTAATGDKRVELTDYDSTTPFTTPSDGIVRIITKAAESSGTSSLIIKGLDNTTPGNFIAMQIKSNSSAEFFGLYVKKGCKIYGVNDGNTSIIDFNPFVS